MKIDRLIYQEQLLIEEIEPLMEMMDVDFDP
jgi:hypothetical protein